MKPINFIFVGLLVFMMSCKTLTSTTYLKERETFVLGDNDHGNFTAQVKNVSNKDLQLWVVPNAGGKHSPKTLKPNEKVKIKVEKNTALSITNDNDEKGAVELLVKGDTGLSMGFKN